MCKINCSGGCSECDPDEHLSNHITEKQLDIWINRLTNAVKWNSWEIVENVLNQLEQIQSISIKHK